jgi:peptide/nickel transport system substrate-binding protein
MTNSTTSQPIDDLQARINDYWSWRGESGNPGDLAIRNERELKTWMGSLQPLLPSPPADVVDLGTGQGFVALVMSALGHRVRGFDLAEGQLARAREYAARSTNPPVFALGDAAAPPLEPASVDVLASRDVLWTLLDPARAFHNWFSIIRPGGRLLVFHGVTLSASRHPETKSRGDSLYKDEVVSQHLLPLRYQPTLDPAVPLAREAGFEDVTISRLPVIEGFVRDLEGKEMVWLVLTATRPAAQRGAQERGSQAMRPAGELRIAFGPDAHLTVAVDATRQPVEALLWGMGETLTRVTPRGMLEPWLAEAVTSVDELTWRVRLRKDALFWDGTPVTADQVAASFRANWATQIATDFMLSKQTQIRALDRTTLEFTTPTPTGNFPYALSYHQLIVHKGDGLMMTGAYRPTEFEADRRLVLEPFRDHWQGTPPLKRITVTYEADPVARVEALRDGSVDLLYGLQPDRLTGLDGEFEVRSSITNRVVYLQLNLSRKPLNDRPVREAISLGIDRAALLAEIQGGYGSIATGFFPEGAGVDVVPVQASDAARAQHLLEAAGWHVGAGTDGVRSKDGQRLAFEVYSYPQRVEITRMAEAIRQQLRPLGFDVRVTEVANIGIQTKYGDFDAAMRSINTLISGDPYFLLAITLGKDGRENTGNYFNAEVERLLVELHAEREPATRQALSRAIQQELRRDVPNVFLLVSPLIIVTRKGRVTGFEAHPFTQYFITNELSVK